MYRKFIEAVPKVYKERYILERKKLNYIRIMSISVLVLVVQFIVVILAYLYPFTSDKNVMSFYYGFYSICICLNIIGMSWLYIIKNRHTLNNIKISVLFLLQIVFLHLWAMGTVIINQYKNESIVIYFLSILVIAIILKVTILEFLGVLIIPFLFFQISLGIYENYTQKILGWSYEVTVASLQFIFFATFIKYYIDELTKRNFLQKIQLEESNQELEYLSYHDSLSGLYNRHRFEMIYSEIFNMAVRKKESICVVLIDIDYFKQYNDYYGHVMGDQIIRLVSRIFIQICEGLPCTFGRYGGDEFIIVFRDTTKEEVDKIIKELHFKLKEANVSHIKSFTSDQLTLSIGIYMGMPIHKKQQWEFVVKADKELYKVKEKRELRIN